MNETPTRDGGPTDGVLGPFDRRAVARHRDRAGARPEPTDFLHREVAARLAERLDDIDRQFPLALDIGCGAGAVARAVHGRKGIAEIVQCDLSERMVRRAGGLAVVADDEALPFAGGRFDLVLSGLALHWTNDLPGALAQVRAALKPDGLLLAALFGGETLTELRSVLLEAEIAETGGASPRASTLIDLRGAGALLQRAGFALPVADRDRITVTFEDAFALMRDLRHMGESNAMAERRRRFTPRATLMRAAALYAERFAGADGRISASFDVIFLTGWAPHRSQPRPVAPGSATRRLAEALGEREIDPEV
ncbi:MAG: methyltransferase domain-containing protein [Alphaproteobacteria bacterium]